MDKIHIVRFLKAKKRGIYSVIVDSYSDKISNTGAAMALELIREDLENETGEKVELNYFSLAQAISKSRSSAPKSGTDAKKKWDFKDSHELKKEESPGKFKLD